MKIWVLPLILVWISCHPTSQLLLPVTVEKKEPIEVILQRKIDFLHANGVRVLFVKKAVRKRENKYDEVNTIHTYFAAKERERTRYHVLPDPVQIESTDTGAQIEAKLDQAFDHLKKHYAYLKSGEPTAIYEFLRCQNERKNP